MMFKIGKCVKVLNPYDWMPLDGENSVKLISDGLNLRVIIGYDNEEQSRENFKELLFEGVCAFYKSLFSDIDILNINYKGSETKKYIGYLVKYPKSEVAEAWKCRFDEHRLQVNHYHIAFLSAEITIHVFASDVKLLDYTKPN